MKERTAEKIVYSVIAISALAVVFILTISFFKLFNIRARFFIEATVSLILPLIICGSIYSLIKDSFLKYVSLGFALAIMSWTLGSLYELSFFYLAENTVFTYPTVADFGFSGCFFLIFSCLGIMKKVDSEDISRSRKMYLVFLVTLIPLITVFWSKSSPLMIVFNFYYFFLSALLLYQAMTLLRLKLYGTIICGTLIFCFGHMLFILVANCCPGTAMPIKAVLPMAFAVILLGLHKNNGAYFD